MFDPDEFLGGPTEKKVNDFDPDAFLGKKPAEAKQPAEPSAWERAKAFGGAVAKPFVDIGRSALAANDFATRALTSPRETFANPGATVREGMRGVNSNIPFANTAVEAAGGPPAESPEDAAGAPGARDFGGVAGMATAGPMLGGIGGALGAGSIARSAARPPGAVKEALKEGGRAVVKATERGAIGSIVGSAVGSPGLGTAIGVAGQLPQIARSAGVVADEGAAALARRLMATRGNSVPASQLAPLESAAAGEAVAPRVTPPPPQAVPRAVNPFDELTQGPQFTQAERAKFIQEMRAAHGGDIPGVTDAPAGNVRSATSELETVAKPGAARAPSNEVINTPGPNPRRYKASDENFAKRLGMTVEDYVAMMDRRLARRAATSP